MFKRKLSFLFKSRTQDIREDNEDDLFNNNERPDQVMNFNENANQNINRTTIGIKNKNSFEGIEEDTNEEIFQSNAGTKSGKKLGNINLRIKKNANNNKRGVSEIKNEKNSYKARRASTTNYLDYSGVSASSINYSNIFENYCNTKIEKKIPSLSADLSASPEDDCVAINDFLNKFIPDQSNVYRILCRRSAAQRENIKSQYKDMFGRELLEMINKVSIYKDHWLGFSLLYTGPDLDAFYINAAIINKNWKYCVLREILCTRSHMQLNLIKESYKKLYDVLLENLIQIKTEEPMKSLFLALLAGNRDKTTLFDKNVAYSDISILLDENIYKANVDKIIEIFTQRSYFQLRLMFELFQAERGYSITKIYVGLIKGVFKKVLKTLVMHTTNSYEYYSYLLQSLIAKESFYDILRVAISRSEIDLGTIVRYYQNGPNGEIINLRDNLKGLFFFNNKIYLEIINALFGF